MFLDTNVPYNNVSAGERASSAMIHLGNIPIKAVAAIIDLVKLIFISVLAGLSFGQSDILNFQVELSAKKFAYNSSCVALSLTGFFAPLNSYIWQQQLVKALMIEKNSKLSEQMNEALFVSNVN